MIQTVLKRDGRIAGFNREKIAAAIRKAMLTTEAGEDEVLISKIVDRIEFKGKEQSTVEEIQNMVEMELMKSPRKEVARSYIAYRDKRSIARKAKTREMFLEIVEAKSNDVTRENANMNADTPAGMMMKFASETTKPFVDDYLLSEATRWAVRNNYLHIHDKDYYPTKSLTCIQHPLDKILEQGFQAGHGESRPTKRIETASIMACISMETVQNEMHGGQAIPAFDFYLAPYVRRSYVEEIKTIEKLTSLDLKHLYDAEIEDYIQRDLDFLQGDERFKQHAINRTINRVHQSMEAFIHNMNTIHSRGGNQVVFSSINYGTDTSAEGRCIIRELLQSTYEGVGGGSTAIFPIQIWKKKRGVSYLPEDKNYDLYQFACKVAARRFFPNFVNLDATYNQHEKWDENDPKRYQYEVATMGCRTRVFENRFGEKTSIARGNLSFSTINIVRLALECMELEDKKQRVEQFFVKLDELLEIAAKQLCDRYNFQKTALAKQFPLLMSALWSGCENLQPNDTVERVINQGTLGIGFIGLAETLIALVGKHHGESEEAQELGLRIVTYMRDRVNEFSERYQHNFSVLATPAEGLSGRFTRIDRKKFGEVAGVTDKIYYTNSNHVPVYYKCSPKHKAEIEAPYHDLTRGGHIFYIEIDGDATHNPQAIMDIVDLMDKNNIGYCSVNHNRNRCMHCGYEDAQPELAVCPKCGNDSIDKLQRITGYLVGTTERWNKAKLAELNDRVIHK
ncbi:MAG: anaerobic ribonucleoside triphosphate reductase [Alistipes sp.]|nr:anaerobic ribonucleoside triphosphate reductase [Alistipes sp.]